MSVRNRHRVRWGLFFCLLPLCLHPLFAAPPLQLKLPFRMAGSGSQEAASLSAEELLLHINGQESPIVTLIHHRRSLAVQKGKKRIVLAFCGGSPGKELLPFLELLQKELLGPGDNLQICTPLASIPLTLETKIPEQILLRLQEDLDTFAALLRTLEQDIAATAESLGKDVGSSQWNKRFTRYERETMRLSQHLRAPFLSRLAESLDALPPDSEGPWLVLFAPDRPIWQRISWPSPWMEGKIGTAKEAAARITSLAEKLDPRRDSQLTALARELLLRRLPALVFNLGEGDPKEGEKADILSVLCQQSGLWPQPFNRAPDAVALLKSHVDHLYEIVYPFDGIMGDKDYLLEMRNGSQQLVTPAHLDASYFSALSEQGHGAALKITQAEIAQDTLFCQIEGIRMMPQGAGGIGRLRVRIRIQDDQGAIRFDEQKELSATRQSISIRLPLADDIRGYLGLIVEVTDLHSNQQAQKRTYLKR